MGFDAMAFLEVSHEEATALQDEYIPTT